MKCMGCGAGDTLFAKVTLEIMVPLAARNGTLKVGGVKVGQQMLLEEWDGKSEEATPVKGPIICSDCATEHYWVTGSKKPLRVGNVDEARAAFNADTLEK